LIALVVLLVMGGAIVARWGFAVGWILETMMSAAGLLIACLMVEPPAAVDEMSAATAFQTRTSVRPTLRIAIVATLAALIVPASCLAGLAGGAAFFAQTSAWANVERSTILVAVVTLAEAMGAYVARYVPATLRMQLLLGVIGVGLLAAAVTIPSALIPATVGLSWLLGAAEPLRATAIQRSTHDSIRARTASLASACDKAAATIALLVAGRLPR
jgi:hypothetical protein